MTSAMTIEIGLKPVPWPAFTDEVLRLYRPPLRRRGTKDKTAQVLGEFAAYCKTTADLDEPAISDWLVDHPGRAPAYVEGLLRHLSAACTYGAHPRRRYLWDPFEERPVSSWLPEDELDAHVPFKRHRPAADIRKVLDRADADALAGGFEAWRDRAFVYGLAYTGAHKMEVLGLRYEDIDLVRRTVAFRSHPGRRLKRRARAAMLPIAEPLAEVWVDYLPRVRELFPRGIYPFPHRYGTGPWCHGRPGHRPLDRVRALGERSDVHGLTIDTFRHTVGSLAEGEDWNIGELALQRILRHARRQTQLSYRHPDLALMRDAVSRIRY